MTTLCAHRLVTITFCPIGCDKAAAGIATAICKIKATTIGTRIFHSPFSKGSDGIRAFQAACNTRSDGIFPFNWNSQIHSNLFHYRIVKYRSGSLFPYRAIIPTGIYRKTEKLDPAAYGIRPGQTVCKKVLNGLRIGGGLTFFRRPSPFNGVFEPIVLPNAVSGAGFCSIGNRWDAVRAKGGGSGGF